MKFKTISLAFISLAVAALIVFSFSGLHDDSDTDKEQKTILKNVRRLLTLKHFQPKSLDDQFSAEVFDYYLELIDPYKRYLTQEDYTQMVKSRLKIDDYIKNPDLSFYHSSIDTLRNRIRYVKDHFQELLEKPFDFNKKDSINLDEKKYQYAKDKKDLLRKWHQLIKFSTLNEIMALQEEQKKKKEAKDSTYKEKSFDAISKEAREKVKDDFKDLFRRLLNQSEKDRFTTYVNAYAQSFDPHTGYFSPKGKQQFDFNISGKLEGIGAMIKNVKGTAIIDRIMIGSPCWKQGELKVGDKILKVAQQGKPPVSILGMNLDDAIRLIRGKKGTTVILSVEKQNGNKKDIPIVRDVIENDAIYAKSAIITDKNNIKYGLISLPEFYFDPNNPKGKNAGTDFEKELLALKADGVKGVVIDLRNNGGGSLETVVNIAGMFIDKGPIVQVETQARNTKVLKDYNPAIQWEGAVVILVNELSASASEILAAALQDYGRAVIIGSRQTFGKGTVQTFYPVNFLAISKDLGSLKLTIQKFYRINGGSTQLKGVSSDIVLSSKLSNNVGEREYDHPLSYDSIRPAKYEKWNFNIDLKKIVEKSAKRMEKDSIFNYLNEGNKWFKKLKEENVVSLNFPEYKKKQEQKKIKAKYFDSIFDNYRNHLKIFSPTYEAELIKTDTVLRIKRKKWHENEEKDIQLKEAINVLNNINNLKN